MACIDASDLSDDKLSERQPFGVAVRAGSR
jgi:hypothetical protein